MTKPRDRVERIAAEREQSLGDICAAVYKEMLAESGDKGVMREPCITRVVERAKPLLDKMHAEGDRALVGSYVDRLFKEGDEILGAMARARRAARHQAEPMLPGILADRWDRIPITIVVPGEDETGRPARRHLLKDLATKPQLRAYHAMLLEQIKADKAAADSVLYALEKVADIDDDETPVIELLAEIYREAAAPGDTESRPAP